MSINLPALCQALEHSWKQVRQGPHFHGSYILEEIDIPDKKVNNS